MSFYIGRNNAVFCDGEFLTETEAESFLIGEGFRKKKTGGFVRRSVVATLPQHYLERGATKNDEERQQVALLQKLAPMQFGAKLAEYAETELGFKLERRDENVEIVDVQHVDIRKCGSVQAYSPGSWKYEFDR